MTAPLYKFYYRQYGVRKVTQLLKPTPIKILSLPRGSLFHYYADDDHDPAIDTSIGILAMNKSRVLVDFTTDYTGELKGIPKKKPFIVRTATREFFKENKMYRYLPEAYKVVNNDLMLFVLNHSYLNTVYRYPELPMTSYYRWHNTYSTIFTKINEVATNSNKHQFIYINVPNDLPTYAIMEMYMTRESLQLLKLFDDNDKLLMLELWKWIDEEQRANSIFNLIDEDKYNKLNIIFKYQDTEVLLNLGYLNSFIKGRPNTTEFKSISQFPVNFIKKLVLRFLINVKNIAVTSAVQATEVPEEDDSSVPFSDSEDQDDDESIVNISNTAYLAQTNKPQKEVPIEAEVDDSVDLDLEAEMGKIDEELANYSKFYNMKLVDKGLTIDKKGNLTETDKHHEVDEASPEELREKVFKARDPSEMLSQTLEELAKNDSVTISEYRKFKKYISEYNNNPSVYDKSKSTKDLIGYSKEVVQLVPENTKVTIPSVVKDTSMANISTNSFNKDYLDKLYHKDIVNVIHSIQKAGIIVKSHTVEEEVSALGEYEYHSVELAPLDGAPSTIYFKIPKINEDGTYVCSNNKYSIRLQRTDFPIRKISPTKVSLSSYYGKSFVELSRMKSNSSVEYLSKNIYRLYKEKQITNLSPGDVSDNYFKSPYIYGSLSSKFKSFTYGDYNFIFDRKLILEKVTPELLAKVEVNGDVICGHVNNSQLIVVDKNSEFHLLTKTGKERLGNIYDMLAIDHKKAPIDFSEFRVYDKHVPVGVYLGYLIGLSGLIKLIGANYSKLERGHTVGKDQYSIKFKDDIYVFDRKQSAATKLLAGFLEYSTSLKSINFKDLDDKNVYYILFEEKKMTSVYIKEMDLANELFVDPVTQSILADMGEPTTFIGLLVKATELLDSFDYPDSQDLSQMRIRGYERISGFIYKEIAKSIKTFKNKNINGRSKVDLGPYDIWNAIMKDNSVKLVEDINPLQDIKERDVVTYVGEGGRDKGSIQKGARSYHDTDYGIISEATVDSADVSINTYLSANPGFKNLRGLVNKVEAKDTPNLLSASANLAPFTLMDD